MRPLTAAETKFRARQHRFARRDDGKPIGHPGNNPKTSLSKFLDHIVRTLQNPAGDRSYIEQITSIDLSAFQ